MSPYVIIIHMRLSNNETPEVFYLVIEDFRNKHKSAAIRSNVTVNYYNGCDINSIGEKQCKLNLFENIVTKHQHPNIMVVSHNYFTFFITKRDMILDL